MRLQATDLYNRMAERIEAISIEMDLDEDAADFDKQVLNYVHENHVKCRLHNS